MNKDTLKIPKGYKTLLILALVFGPFFWLAFTDDGQRRTDLALMFVLSKPELNAALDAFTSGITESQLRETFPKLELQCADGANPFGDRLCGAEIGSFNQMPASSVTLFLAGDRLQAVKITYRRAYHAVVQAWVRGRVAVRETSPLAARLESDGPSVMAQPVDDGVLVMRDGDLGDEDEPALIWLSQEAIGRRS